MMYDAVFAINAAVTEPSIPENFLLNFRMTRKPGGHQGFIEPQLRMRVRISESHLDNISHCHKEPIHL